MKSVTLPAIHQSTAASLAGLSEQTARYVEAGLQGAPNTAKAYASDLRHYSHWCQANELEPLLATIDMLAGYVTYLADAGKKVATLQRHLSINKAPAFKLKQLKRLVREIDIDTVAGLRDRVILLLGFTGAFSRSEPSDLNLENLHFTEECIIVSMPRSKTNQLG